MNYQKNPKNIDVRRKIKEEGFAHWQIADAMGISEITFCRWLRYELPEDKKQKIYSIMEELKG